jgi:hypothetical protein
MAVTSCGDYGDLSAYQLDCQFGALPGKAYPPAVCINCTP